MRHTELTFTQYCARLLITCYPGSWRQRYAEEMLQILEYTNPTYKTLFNLLLQLCDAYLHPDLVKGRNPFMMQKIRFNVITIYGATLIFFVPWLFVRGHFIDFAHLVLFPSISLTDPLATIITRSISHILLFLILAGGLPILLAACWQAVKERKFLVLLLCLLSLISPPIAVFASMAINMGSLWQFLPFSMVIGLGLSLAFITFSVQHVAPSRRVTHYALSLATVIPLVMLIGLTTLMIKVIPSLFALVMAGESLLYILREDLLILLMGATLVLIIISLKKGFEAKRVRQEEAVQQIIQEPLQ